MSQSEVFATFVPISEKPKLSQESVLKEGTVNESHQCFFCTLSSGVKIVELKHVETCHSKWIT